VVVQPTVILLERGKEGEGDPMKTWTLAGHLSTGEAVYWQKGGGLAVGKDHAYLANATPEEKAEIYKTMSHLKPVKEAES
jgi:hypothetical protein